MKQYVLELYKMPYASPEGNTFCNCLYNYFAEVLDRYMEENVSHKQDVENLKECMRSAYILGIGFGIEQIIK